MFGYKETRKDIDEDRKQGFSINYTKLKTALHKCEVENAEKKQNVECKKALKELGIDLIDET